MGSEESKAEVKTVDSTGAVNNNLVINDPVQIEHKLLEILLWTICIIKILEFLLLIYKIHRKNLKKQFTNNPA